MGTDPSASYYSLIKVAQKYGVKVVGVETSAAVEIGASGSILRDLNYYASKIFKEHQAASPGSWVFLAGGNHIASSSISVGIAERTNAASLLIEHSDAPGRQVLFKHRIYGGNAKPDVVIQLGRTPPV